MFAVQIGNHDSVRPLVAGFGHCNMISKVVDFLYVFMHSLCVLQHVLFIKKKVILVNRLSYSHFLNDKGIDLFSFFFFSTFLLSVLMATVAFNSKVQLLVYFLVFCIFTAVVLLESYMVSRREFSFYLAIPVLISATQNVYLGVVSPFATDTQIRIMLITNFLFSIILMFILFLRTPYRFNQELYNKALTILILLIFYSIGTIGIFHVNITSGLASLRNIIAPMMFLLIGLLGSSNVYLKRFLKYVTWIAVFVLFFGVLERFFLKDIWVQLNLADLWQKKGIPINPITGLPPNFYSSELIGGQQLRRMVSSFADPVNLGTFLFFSFMAAWYLKKRVLAVMLVISFFLVVSKGALLGFLVFCVVWSYYKLSKTGFVLVLTGAGLAGIAFVFYSLTNSTLSMVLHFTGFIAAFKELIFHPLGRGLGNVGVLAGLYSSGVQTEIAESGLGMVIGQLGIGGLVLYLYFFIFVYKNSNRIQEISEKILAKSLLFSILPNIMFNEVALSPNSSAVYFITLGTLIGQWYMKTKDIPQVKKNRRKIVW